MNAAPLAYRVAVAAGLIGLSERATWRLIACGDLTAVRVGRATLIPRISLEQWLERKLAEQA